MAAAVALPRCDRVQLPQAASNFNNHFAPSIRHSAVLQRVKSASVTVDGQLISTIGKGLLIFAAVGKDDTKQEAERMASKVLKLKMWEDDNGGKWKRNVVDIEGEVLCVSQFTLLASTKKGNKPDFHRSAAPPIAKELYDAFFNKVKELYNAEKVKDGVFQAMMDVALVNDGPVGVDYLYEDGAVTLEIDTDPPKMEVFDKKAPWEENDVEVGKGDPVSGHIHKTFTLPAELLE